MTIENTPAVLSESVLLAIVTVVLGGIVTIVLKNVEGKHATRIEEIKSNAEALECRLANASQKTEALICEKKELQKEIKELEKEVVQLELDVDKWRTRSYDIEQKMHELRLIFLRVMQRAEIPTDQYEDLVALINRRMREGNG